MFEVDDKAFEDREHYRFDINRSFGDKISKKNVEMHYKIRNVIERQDLWRKNLKQKIFYLLVYYFGGILLNFMGCSSLKK